jgi:translation factor GUF1, mitochondrial
LPHADVERAKYEIMETLDIDPDESIEVSAKTGVNMDQILRALVEKVPHPNYSCKEPLKMLLFDSWFDNYRGVIALVAVKDGRVQKGQTVRSFHTDRLHVISELGLVGASDLIPTNSLEAGQIGYIITSGLKVPRDAKIGDTFYNDREPIDKCLPGFRKADPMVFAGVFPVQTSDFDHLSLSMEKLLLTDNSISVSRMNRYLILYSFTSITSTVVF